MSEETHWSDIPYSNRDTDRAFDTLLAALEELAPGIRADLKFVLIHRPPNELMAGRPEREGVWIDNLEVDTFLQLPTEDKAAFEGIAAHAPRDVYLHGKTHAERGLAFFFPRARTLRILYDEVKSCHLNVHAGDANGSDGIRAVDRFSVEFGLWDRPTDTVLKKQVEGWKNVDASGVGPAPSFADALRFGLNPEIGAFAQAIRDFRRRVESQTH